MAIRALISSLLTSGRVTRRSRMINAFLLTTALLITSMPWAAGNTFRRSNAGENVEGIEKAPSVFTKLQGQKPGMPAFPPPPPRQQPRPTQTKEEREARVARIQLSGGSEQWIASGQRFSLGAMPVDRNDNPVHGLRARWTTSNKRIVFVSEDGQAIAGTPGTAQLVGEAAGRKGIVVVHVYDDGPARKMRATTSSPKSELIARRSRKRSFAHASMPEPPDDRLPDTETTSLYQPVNKIGKPAGKTEAGAATSGAANDSVETPGSSNYTFSLGIEGLPGRQLNASLSMVYNSRIWHKVVTGSTTKLYFDVDYSWPAAGFRLGYGQIEYQGTAGFTLVDPDGTRRQMTSIGAGQYRTTDGSVITFAGDQYGGTATYPDGTRVSFSAKNGPCIYPIRITDRNGNFIDISYAGAGPKIAWILDTVGRYIRFYYSNGELIAITAPGYDDAELDRPVARFYYETLEFPQHGMFLFGMSVTKPAQIRILRYVYMPGTQSGYRYDYMPYGMIYRTSQLRGMTIDNTSLTAMGSVTSDGQTAATTEYTFETGLGLNPNQTDMPKYYYRTDSWAGITVSPPVWTFTADQANGITTVYNPDGTITETQSNTTDGQVQSVTLKYQGAVLSKINYAWEWSTVGQRLEKIETTNDNNQTRATTFDYDPATIFNNVSMTSELDFASPGTLGAELRRTETTYENSTLYTSRGLIHLPKSVKVFAGGSSVPASHVEYAYDGSSLLDRPGIEMLDPTYNPSSPEMEQCDWQWNGWDYELVCGYYPVYDPSTAHRGNVTSVTAYSDAANTTGPQTNTLSYDIAGNVVEQSVNCCRRKTYGYSSSYQFAYVTSETRGDTGQLTNEATFDLNTGLVRTVKDENQQTSIIHYYPQSLRYHRTDFPDGGHTAVEYNDALVADPDAAHMHSSTMSTIATTSGTVINRYDFYDGRGAAVRHFGAFTAADGGQSTMDIEYDGLGRVRRVSNPYYSASGAQSAINPDGFWTTNSFDGLGRITHVTMPRGDDNNQLNTSIQTVYNGTITTVIDQAGKQHRQITDALGRVVRVDEPGTNGSLGEVANPAQATSYQYDTLDNLIHIVQGAQHRYFRYDSLSRLTHDRQVEQDAPWTTSDSVAGNNQWSRKFLYNSQSLIEDAYDARQVRTNFVYDGLNRVKEIHYFGSNQQPDPATPDAYYWYDSQTLPPGAPSFNRGYSTGRLVAMTYGGTTASPSPTGNYVGYDKMGRVERQRQVTGSTTYALSYTYNLAGQLTSETYPSNRQLSYGYDEAGRPSQISEGATIYANTFRYEPHGALKAETIGNGMVRSLSYNRRLQPAEIKLKQSASGPELQRFNYSYGQVNETDGGIDTSKNNGQIGRIDGYINGVKQWDQRMIYDPLGRLSTAAEYRGDNPAPSGKVWQAHYDHDRFGNRFQYQSNSNINYTTVQTTDVDPNRNRFIETGATPINYDPAGNIITDAKFRGMNYQYDANGRMTFAERTDHTNQQTSVYDCAGQRVRTVAGSVTRTIVYNIFGENVTDYLGSDGTTLERENIYRGGELLATFESGAAALPTALAATVASGNITLNWSAASGAGNYRVERKEADEEYGSVGTTTSPTFIDNNAELGSAYLYRVCAADGTNNCTSGYSNVVMGARLNFPTDPTLTTTGDDPSGETVTTMKAGHITELRAAVNAVRSLADLPAATWTHETLTPFVTDIRKEDVNELRTKLNEALTALGVRTSDWIDHPVAGSPNGTPIRGVQITQLRQCATKGSSCYKPIAQFVKDFYQGALHRLPTPEELSTWTATLEEAQRSGQLLAAAQSLGSTLFNSAEYVGFGTSNAQFVTDLYTGYLQRTHDLEGHSFWLSILNGSNDRAHLKAAFAGSPEFGDDVNALCAAPATGGGLHFVLSDLQGSARALMNNGAYGNSVIVARHDYLPFGEEIGSNTGMRTSGQGYGVVDSNRWKYATTERDGNGLDHTWWRKYENTSGRWTSPDPLSGTVPQSLNAYTYAGNDPVNFIDPSGLLPCEPGVYSAECGYSGFGGWGGGFDMNARVSLLGNSGRQTIRDAEDLHNRRLIHHLPFDESIRKLPIEFGVTIPFFGYRGGKALSDCYYLASFVDSAAKEASSDSDFVQRLRERFTLHSSPTSATDPGPRYSEFRSSGFKGRFKDEAGSFNQVRHFVGAFTNAFAGGRPAAIAASFSPGSYPLAFAAAVRYALRTANSREHANEHADRRLNEYGVKMGVRMGFFFLGRDEIGGMIRDFICGSGW